MSEQQFVLCKYTTAQSSRKFWAGIGLCFSIFIAEKEVLRKGPRFISMRMAFHQPESQEVPEEGSVSPMQFAVICPNQKVRNLTPT